MTEAVANGPARPPAMSMRSSVTLTGAGLMAATGLAFPQAEHFAFVALVAFVGTVNPSTGDLGVLVPLEHSMLAGALAAAAPDFLEAAGIAKLMAFKLMFYFYALLGVLSAALYRRLPRT